MSKLDRPALAEGALAGLRQDERSERVLPGHRRRSFLENRRREALELERIGIREALREVVDPIHGGAPRREPDVVRTPMVADPNGRMRAHDLRRAFVAV